MRERLCVNRELSLYPLGDMTLLLTYSRHVVWGAFLWARTTGFLSSWLLWFYSDNKRYKTFTFLEVFSHRNASSELYQLNSKWLSCKKIKFSIFLTWYVSTFLRLMTYKKSTIGLNTWYKALGDGGKPHLLFSICLVLWSYSMLHETGEMVWSVCAEVVRGWEITYNISGKWGSHPGGRRERFR